MILITKGLGQGKHCCYLICSCKLGVNLPKPFLHRANNEKKVSEWMSAVGLGQEDPAFPAGPVAVTEFYGKCLSCETPHPSTLLNAKV